MVTLPEVVVFLAVFTIATALTLVKLFASGCHTDVICRCNSEISSLYEVRLYALLENLISRMDFDGSYLHMCERLVRDG